MHSYVAIGAGLAEVRATTVLTVSGTASAPESLGVRFGSDLNGIERKGLIMVGGGATMTFGKWLFADLSFRCARILPKESVIEGDTGVNTQRVQIGIGIRF